MRAHDWADVWNFFLGWLSHQDIPIQIAIGLGAAFVAVMTLEGIRASFFPRRILQSAALRDVAPSPATGGDFAAPDGPRANCNNESAAQTVTVNSDTARRSGPQPLRILGQRKPS